MVKVIPNFSTEYFIIIIIIPEIHLLAPTQKAARVQRV
jgi:hypothetical protein